MMRDHCRFTASLLVAMAIVLSAPVRADDAPPAPALQVTEEFVLPVVEDASNAVTPTVFRTTDVDGDLISIRAQLLYAHRAENEQDRDWSRSYTVDLDQLRRLARGLDMILEQKAAVFRDVERPTELIYRDLELVITIDGRDGTVVERMLMGSVVAPPPTRRRSARQTSTVSLSLLHQAVRATLDRIDAMKVADADPPRDEQVAMAGNGFSGPAPVPDALRVPPPLMVDTLLAMSRQEAQVRSLQVLRARRRTDLSPETKVRLDREWDLLKEFMRDYPPPYAVAKRVPPKGRKLSGVTHPLVVPPPVSPREISAMTKYEAQAHSLKVLRARRRTDIDADTTTRLKQEWQLLKQHMMDLKKVD